MCQSADIKKIAEKSEATRQALLSLLKEIQAADLCPGVKDQMVAMLHDPTMEFRKFALNIELLSSIWDEIEEIVAPGIIFHPREN